MRLSRGLIGQVAVCVRTEAYGTLGSEVPVGVDVAIAASTDEAVNASPSSMQTLNRADDSHRRKVISHAHARDLAECWQDPARDHHPVTLLARTGEITREAELSLAHDLTLLEMASASWGSPPSIPEKQLQVLLDYVRHHGPRPPQENWSQLRDAEFLRSIRHMASEVRARHPVVYEAPQEWDMPPTMGARHQQRSRR